MCNRSLYYLCKEVLGYKDTVPHVHGELAYFATHPSYGRFRSAVMPRSWFKTWFWTVGKSLWLTLPDEEQLYTQIYPFKGPDIRILVASNVIDNASKMLHKIKHEWMTNDRLRHAYPEIVPDFNNTRWSDHCAEVKRKVNATEGTYTAIGAGGSVVSQHFDHIIEDDLIYAKKDDFTGAELMPNQDDIDKAIGWHKIAAYSLFVDPNTSTMDNVGTRWAPNDLIAYIRKYETKYRCFEIAVTEDAEWPGDPVWPERYDTTILEEICGTQGIRIFETQYLNRPTSSQDIVFKTEYLVKHDSLQDYPEGLEYVTVVDLAGWSDSKGQARNVVLTGAKCSKNHLWIGRLDVGRFNPTQVIELIKAHVQHLGSRVLVEEVQYQRALSHFARKDMEDTGFDYDIAGLPADNKKGAKDARIRSVEPLVTNGFLHILYHMRHLIDEMDAYTNTGKKTVDILDCLGWLKRITRPAEIDTPPPVDNPFSIEYIERELKEKSHTTRYPFESQLTPELILTDNNEMVFKLM